MLRQIRKSSKKTRKHKGGALYTFGLSEQDRVGNQASRISLNGTKDGDCPNSLTQDLGFTNYGLTKGGKRVMKRSKRNNKSKKSKSNKKSKISKKNKRHHKK